MRKLSILFITLLVTSFQLNCQCNLDSSTFYQINTINGKALSGKRIIYKTTVNNNTQILEYLKRDTLTGKISPDSKITSTLNIKGQAISVLYEYYDKSKFINSGKHDYTFDSLGRIKSELRYEVDFNKNLIPKYKFYYDYDSQNNFIYTETLFIESNITTSETIAINYNQKNDPIKKIIYSKGSGSGGNKVCIYTYNRNGKIESSLCGQNSKNIKFDESDLAYFTKELYFYNSNNDLRKIESYYKELITDPERLRDTIGYTYDANGRIVFKGNDFYSNTYTYIPNGYIEYLRSGELFEINYYSCIHTKNSTISLTESIEIHPNPVSTEMQINHSIINNSSYTIYDLNGKILKQSNLNGSNLISIEDLNNGIYIIRLINNGKILQGKFIKI